MQASGVVVLLVLPLRSTVYVSDSYRDQLANLTSSWQGMQPTFNPPIGFLRILINAGIRGCYLPSQHRYLGNCIVDYLRNALQPD